MQQWNPNPVGPSDMTDENRFGPAENISFPDRMSGNVFSDNELKKCPKRFNIKNTISQIVFSCGFIFDSREQTFGTIFLLPYVHDKLYGMKSPMFKTLKWIGFLFATLHVMSASKTQTSNFRFNVLSDGVKLFDREQLVSVGCISNWKKEMIIMKPQQICSIPSSMKRMTKTTTVYMDGFLDEMSVWENLSMFTREWMY